MGMDWPGLRLGIHSGVAATRVLRRGSTNIMSSPVCTAPDPDDPRYQLTGLQAQGSARHSWVLVH